MPQSAKNICVLLALVSACLFITSCSTPKTISSDNGTNAPFAGNWQGDGIDSQGNEFSFYAKVIDLGDDRYRILILDQLDTNKKPMHIMEGQLKNNTFTYSADQGLYTGSGVLTDNLFEAHYKGPIDGTYKMWPIK